MYARRGNVTAGARDGGNLSTPVPIAGPEPASEDGAEGAGGVLCEFKEGREKGLKGDRHQDLIRLSLGGLLESISPPTAEVLWRKRSNGPRRAERWLSPPRQ